jgi:hypothetical protein
MSHVHVFLTTRLCCSPVATCRKTLRMQKGDLAGVHPFRTDRSISTSEIN